MPKGKKKDEAAKEDVPYTPVEKAVPTERELKLKAQLEAITEELQRMRAEVEELRQENDFLQQEAQQIRVETHEYLAYVSKKTQKRQTAVISLSDRNAEKIKEIQTKKEEMIQNYSKQRGDLGDIILNKEAELSNIRKELEQLHEYRVLQEEQQSEIGQLEKRVCAMRTKHNEAVQKLKARFLEEKNEFQLNSEEQLKELDKEARKEAYQYLHDHTIKIKLENRSVRKELLELIQRTRALHKHKLELENQKKILLREKEYANNLQRMRKARTSELYKAYGVQNKESVD